MRKIPFFDYPHVFTREEGQLLEIIRDVGRRGAFILQRDLRELEQNLAEYIGVKYALGVSNGTDALLMALRANGIGVGEEDEVVFCSHTFVATAGAIHFAGAVPVPVEAQSDHQIDPESVRKAITSKTKAIVPTQLNGRCCDMEALERIARSNNLLIIEDAAQGLGAKFRGKMAGSFGQAAGMSFYPAKVLGALGDAGAVLTNDPEVYRSCALQRDHGRDPQTGEVVEWGLNLRMDNLQAAILSFKLRRYDEVVRRRREIAQMYQDALGGVSPLILPPPPAPVGDSDYFDIYQNYELEAEGRDELQCYLSERGIATLVQWGGKAVHQWEHLQLGQGRPPLPYTERLFTRMLMLPVYMSISDDDIAYICEQIVRFYGN